LSDLMSFMAWSAAEDASSAANDAAHAANRAADESARHSELVKNQADADKQNALNKMLQDLFYDREPDLYRLSELQSFVGRYPQFINRIAFSKRTYFPPFPWRAGLITAVLFTTVILWDGWFKWVFLVMAGLGARITQIDFNEWKYYRDNREQIEIDRLKTIDETYTRLMTNLANEFSMLSARGVVAKYYIDMNVSNTFKVLYKQNAYKAEKALLKLYYLVLELREMDMYEEARIVKIFHNREEIEKLANQSKLFTSESLNVYSNYMSQLN